MSSTLYGSKKPVTVERQIGGKTVSIESGRFAKQAGGAVVVRVGDTMALVAVVSGYLLHSRWSFRGHGAGVGETSWKFLAVSLFSYGANTFWVWLLTDDAVWAGPWWWPLLPILFVTPLATFLLNRLWVFR